MTPELFQDDLIAELKKLLKDRKWRCADGTKKQFNYYAQNIPIEESDDDADPIPYIIVRLLTGKDAGGGSDYYTCKVVVIIGIYNPDKDAQGHRDLLSVINLIYQRFEKHTGLADKYTFLGEMDWTLQEDGYHPYYFGAVTMEFAIPRIRREDDRFV